MHIHAIAALKSQIDILINRIVEINTQVGPLLSEKEELELIAQEIENSIKVLGSLNDQA